MLRQVADRNGALEIALPQRDETGEADEPAEWNGHLVWRVRVLSITDEEIIVEEPAALGQQIPISAGVRLIGVLPVGQNRWMFWTSSLGGVMQALNGSREVRALRLAMPETVERCQRRSFYRVSTVGLDLPAVDCRALLDLNSAIPAEAASRARVEALRDGQVAGFVTENLEAFGLPDAGPPFPASLVNIGGGGVGLMVEPDHAGALVQQKRYWLNIPLLLESSTPIGAVARLTHIHLDSQQRRYAGMAFEFDHNPSYRGFLVDLLCRYVTELQRAQLRRRAEKS